MPQSRKQLSSDRQALYLVQWFAMFSGFQRTDFLQDNLLPIYRPFLKAKLLLQNADELGNGIAKKDLDNEQLPSIFQCRMKLFSDWYPTWSNKERIEFLVRLKNLDADFLKEFFYYFFTENKIETSQTYIQVLKATPEVEDAERDELISRLALDEEFANELEAIRIAKHSSVSPMPLIDKDKIGVNGDSTGDNHNKVNGSQTNGNHSYQEEEVNQQQQPHSVGPLLEVDQEMEINDNNEDGDSRTDSSVKGNADVEAEAVEKPNDTSVTSSNSSEIIKEEAAKATTEPIA